MYISTLILLPICLVSYTYATYYSQFKQDQHVNTHFFHNMKNGIFVDIGAHNGVTYSNTLFFEKELEWQGICIEPIPEIYKELLKNRTSLCIQGCITDSTGIKDFLRVTSPYVNTEMLSGLLEKYDKRHLARVDKELARYGGTKEIIKVTCYQLNDLAQAYDITHIDYLSIDTEGGELDILKSINFDLLPIHIIDVENNFPKNRSIQRFMESKGFTYVAKLGCDEIYQNKHFIRP